LLGALIAILTFIHTPAHSEEKGITPTRLEAAVKSLAAMPGMESATLGVAVLPLEGGDVLFDYNGRKSLVPASAVKVITTGAALTYLGPDYRFKTTLQTDSDGNVFIKGSGDPTFARYSTEEIFDTFTAQLKAAGIDKIKGAVVGDATAFDSQLAPDTWQYYDMGNYFGAGASGLTFLKNSYRAYFNPGRSAGSPAKFLRTSPVIPGLKFSNEMRTGSSGSGDRGFIYAAPYTDHAFLRGTIPLGRPGFSIRGSMPDPALTCSQFFAAHLEKAGIQSAQPATTMRLLELADQTPKADRINLHTHESAPLSEIAHSTNHLSINLYAEALLKAVAYKRRGVGSTKRGTEELTNFVGSLGIKTTGLHIADGSGLSRLNGVTPRQFVYLLKGIQKGEQGDEFLRTLPVAGKSGTLKYIGGGTAAAGRIRAKSGTLERIKCYVGYADSTSGERYAFAIMVNNFTGSYYPIKSGIERIMAAIATL